MSLLTDEKMKAISITVHRRYHSSPLTSAGEKRNAYASEIQYCIFAYRNGNNFTLMVIRIQLKF